MAKKYTIHVTWTLGWKLNSLFFLSEPIQIPEPQLFLQKGSNPPNGIPITFLEEPNPEPLFYFSVTRTPEPEAFLKDSEINKFSSFTTENLYVIYMLFSRDTTQKMLVFLNKIEMRFVPLKIKWWWSALKLLERTPEESKKFVRSKINFSLSETSFYSKRKITLHIIFVSQTFHKTI